VLSLEIIAKGELGPANWLITSRWTGVSEPPFNENNFAINVGDKPQAVAANRLRLAKEINKQVIYPVACHSDKTTWVLDEKIENIEMVDGLITRNKNVALAVLSADCATVLLYAQELAAIAALHAGWKGMKDHILTKTISEMKNNGASKIFGILGPAICANCYPVSKARFDEVRAIQPEAAILNDNHEMSIDVRAGLKAQLRANEIDFKSVDLCSFESSDLFSYRRDEQTGRNASVIWFRD